MFSLEMTIRKISGLAVVALCGELDIADIPDVVPHLIAAAAACGSIIVDLTDLAYISCGGLGVLVRIRKMTRALGGELLLVGPQPRVHLILEVTGLNAVFSVYPTVRQAALALSRLAS